MWIQHTVVAMTTVKIQLKMYTERNTVAIFFRLSALACFVFSRLLSAMGSCSMQRALFATLAAELQAIVFV